MGISILSGVTLSLGASLFLFFATNLVFFKFLILISFTEVIAFLVSMVFFGSVCHVIGPQDGVGDIPFYYIERQFTKLNLGRFFVKPYGKIRAFYVRNFSWMWHTPKETIEESQTQSTKAKRTDSSQGKFSSSNPNNSSESYVPQKYRRNEAKKTKLNKIVEQP